MNFRETTIEDFEYLKTHSVSRGLGDFAPVQSLQTLEEDGIPLVVIGFIFINKTTAWGFFDMSEAGKKCIHSTYRTIKEWIDLFCKTHKVRRLQVYVECDFSEAIRTVEHLGFQRETVMDCFVGDKPAYLYRRLFTWRS